MSFELPSRVAPAPRRTAANVLEVQRQTNDDAEQHKALCAELRLLAQKQAQRIEKLKVDTAVQLEHHATLRRLELEQRKSQALQQIADLTPRLEVVRAQWNHAKTQNQGYEMEWGNLRTQYQQTKLRVDSLRDQIAHGRQQAEDTRRLLTEMREQLHKLERDKAGLRAKAEHALVCQVKDESYLATRVAEEELYRAQVEKALGQIEAQYQDSTAQHQQEITPLQEDVRLLATYLEEMQDRSKKLREKCLELEGTVATVEDHWLDAVHSVFEQLERANHLDQLKNVVLSALEQHMIQCDQKLVRAKAGNADAYWLQHAVLVWEVIVKEVTQERQKLQVRDDSSQLLAEVSQRCQKAKDTLTKIKSKVEEQGSVRRMNMMDITELHFLLIEKKETEEQMMKFLQEVATNLDEDLARVLYVVRKETFDDYVSSTEHEEDVDDLDAQKMLVETHDDISNLVSSLDLDPTDGDPDEKVRNMSHRPEGPLRGFTQAQARRRTLEAQTGGARQRDQQRERRRTLPPNTLERALMDVQVKVADEVITYVRNRAQSISQGLLDPSQDRLQADPRYVARAKETSSRIERWVQGQREDPSKGLNFIRRDLEGGQGQSGTSVSGAPQQYARIVIQGERIPTEIARANPIAKAQFYATLAVRGHVFQVYPRRSLVPEARQVFLSRDFTKIMCRRVTMGEEDEDLLALRVDEITDILLGHASEVFRNVVQHSRLGLRAETAFSFKTRVNTTLDCDCDSAEARTYWASIFAWVINELRPGGGILATLLKSNKLTVANNGTRGPREDRASMAPEVKDRSVLFAQISNV